MRIDPELIKKWIFERFEYKSRKDGEEIIICNPLNGDTGYHLNINTSKGVCHDWRGDEWAGPKSPTFINFVMLYEDCSFSQAIKAITGKNPQYYKNKLNSAVERRESSEDLVKLPDGCVRLSESSSSFKDMIYKWFLDRSISRDVVDEYEVHHVHEMITWPYYEYDSLVYWQQRSFLKKSFLFPDGNQDGKSKYLYGFDRIEPLEDLYITESIIDCMSCDVNMVAVGGTSISEMQIKKIKALNPARVILAPDNDRAGISSIMANMKLVSNYFSAYFVIPPTHDDVKDWNDLLSKSNRNCVNEILSKPIKLNTINLMNYME